MKRLTVFMIPALLCVLTLSCKHENKKSDYRAPALTYTNVSLQAANGKYVCCQAGLKGLLTANRDKPAEWELFRMTRIRGNFIALMGVNNKYVSVLCDDGNILAAQASQITASEIFEIKYLNDSISELKAYNGYYVCYDSSRYNKLFATGLHNQQCVPVKIAAFTKE